MSWLEFLFLLLPLFLFLFLRSPVLKGSRGEAKVNIGLNLLLDTDVYRLIEDVTLPFGDGTTQIDHLVVSPYGVFVVETKNMKGWISGSPHDARWTQTIYRRRFRFRNPVRQNYKHVKAMQGLFGLRSHQVHGVVVFVGGCSFRTPMPPEVVHGVANLAQFIRSKRVRVLAEDEVRGLIEDVSDMRLQPGFRTNRRHARYVKAKIDDRSADSGTDCPRCGSEMVERVNKRSDEIFLGCIKDSRDAGARVLFPEKRLNRWFRASPEAALARNRGVRSRKTETANSVSPAREHYRNFMRRKSGGNPRLPISVSGNGSDPNVLDRRPVQTSTIPELDFRRNDRP